MSAPPIAAPAQTIFDNSYYPTLGAWLDMGGAYKQTYPNVEAGALPTVGAGGDVCTWMACALWNAQNHNDSEARDGIFAIAILARSVFGLSTQCAGVSKNIDGAVGHWWWGINSDISNNVNGTIATLVNNWWDASSSQSKTKITGNLVGDVQLLVGLMQTFAALVALCGGDIGTASGMFASYMSAAVQGPGAPFDSPCPVAAPTTGPCSFAFLYAAATISDGLPGTDSVLNGAVCMGDYSNTPVPVTAIGAQLYAWPVEGSAFTQLGPLMAAAAKWGSPAKYTGPAWNTITDSAAALTFLGANFQTSQALGDIVQYSTADTPVKTSAGYYGTVPASFPLVYPYGHIPPMDSTWVDGSPCGAYDSLVANIGFALARLRGIAYSTGMQPTLFGGFDCTGDTTGTCCTATGNTGTGCTGGTPSGGGQPALVEWCKSNPSSSRCQSPNLCYDPATGAMVPNCCPDPANPWTTIPLCGCDCYDTSLPNCNGDPNCCSAASPVCTQPQGCAGTDPTTQGCLSCLAPGCDTQSKIAWCSASIANYNTDACKALCAAGGCTPPTAPPVPPPPINREFLEIGAAVLGLTAAYIAWRAYRG